MHEIVRLLLHDESRQADVECFVPPSSTLADLVSELGHIGETPADRPDTVWVDRKALDARTPIDRAGLRNGSTIGVAPPPDTEASASVAGLDQLAGVSGADTTNLAVGRFDFSPADDSPTTDFRVSDLSFSLDVATDGSLIVIPRGRPVVVGNRRISEPRRLETDVLNIGTARFAGAGAISTHDPDSPRFAVSSARRIAPPSMPDEHEPRLSLRWLALLPVAIGLAIAGIIVSPWLVIASAVALVAALWFLVQEHRAEREEQRVSRLRRDSIAREFEHAIASERRHVESDLRTAQPPLVLLDRAAEAADSSGSDELWSRSIGEHDFGVATLAYGEIPWRIEVAGSSLDPLLRWGVDANDALTSVPVTGSLADGPIGIVGRRNVALSCARALLLEAAAHAAPHEMQLALAAPADRLDDWDWLKWLPHFAGPRALATTDDEADTMVSRWRGPGHDWLQVVLVDQTDWFTDDRLLTTILGEPGKQCPIIVAPTADLLPPCAAIVSIEGDGLAEIRVGPAKTSLATPVGASAAFAEKMATRLARLADPEVELHESLPDDVVSRFRLRRPVPRQPEPDPVGERASLLPPPIPTDRGAVPEPPIVDLTATREQLS